MPLGPHAESEAEVLEKHPVPPVGERLSVTAITPRASVVVAGDADEVIAPGVEGEFGILPGHVAFISALKAGVLTIRTRDRRQVFAVGPGYLQVSAGGKTQVLVQQAVAADAVDVGEASADKSAAEEQLKALGDAPGEQAALRAKLAWAQARLDATGKGRG